MNTLDNAGYIKIWDIKFRTSVQTIDVTNFGSVTTLIWIRLPEGGDNAESAAFAAGFELGIIGIFKDSKELV